MMQPDRAHANDSGNGEGRASGSSESPQIIAFCCQYCAYAAADLAGSKRMQYPPGVRIIHTPCTGNLEMEHMLEAFEKGVDGILVVGCLEGGCHFVEGNLRARRRVERIRSMLEEIGLGSERLQMVNISDSMAQAFVKHMQDMMETIQSLGPSPLRASPKTESAGTL